MATAFQQLNAQGCAMCQTSASNLNEESAKGLNRGIIYLATIPLAFIFGTGYYWIKKNRTNGQS